MQGYFSRFPARPGLDHVQSLIRTLGFTIGTIREPGFVEGDERLDVISQIAQAVDGVLFRPSGFYDPSGRLLFGARGHDPDAEWPKGFTQLLGRKNQIQEIEARATDEALARRERSMARLCEENVPVNKHLPAIEDASTALRRDKEEVAWRAMALLVVAMKGEGMDQSTVDRIVGDYGLLARFSPAEAAFIQDPAPTDHTRIQFAWRYEAAWTLFWALGYVEELEMPTHICDVPQAVGLLRDRKAVRFIDEARLRPLDLILDEADLIYRYHWAIVNARINGKPMPAGLEPGVTQERHYALNWLIGYMDQEWDEITTDT